MRMTIEVGFVPEGSDVKVVVGEIALGCYGTFSDYSAGGNRTVISAFCRDDDSGGEVFAFGNEGFPEVGPWRVLPAEVHAEYCSPGWGGVQGRTMPLRGMSLNQASVLVAYKYRQSVL
jgi:hypothetical protein